VPPVSVTNEHLVVEKTGENFVIDENFAIDENFVIDVYLVIDEYFVILSEAKDLCTLLAAPKMHRSFAAKNAAQDDKPRAGK
jgi:hypothetical protein